MLSRTDLREVSILEAKLAKEEAKLRAFSKMSSPFGFKLSYDETDSKAKTFEIEIGQGHAHYEAIVHALMGTVRQSINAIVDELKITYDVSVEWKEEDNGDTVQEPGGGGDSSMANSGGA